MRLLSAIISALAALAASGLSPVLGGAPKPAGTTVTLRAAATDLARIALATGQVDEEKVRQHEVSDMLVRLSAADGSPLAAALLQDSVDRPERGRPRTLMVAELILVSGGRLLVEERLRCASWVAEAATCRMPCDGGSFVIARRRESDRITLRLVVGETTPGAGSPGPRLAACDERADGIETSLVPRRGPIAEIALVRD